MGVTFAFLNISGRDPSDNDLLNRINTGLILYVLSTIFQLNRDGSSWVEPVLS